MGEMVKALPEEKITPADELRGVLSECERAVGELRGSGKAALTLLHGLDRLAELWPQLEASGVDLRPERARLTTLEGQLRRKAGTLLRELQASGGLAKARQAVQPDRSHWWWYLDEELRAARRRNVRRALLGFAIIAVLAVGALGLYQRFLAPDPVTLRVQELQTEGEELASQGEYATALARFEEALTLRPDDPELYLWQGVLYEASGQREEAAKAFEAARTLFGQATAFHFARGFIYARLQQVEKIEAEAQAILAIDPHSPQGHFLLGNVYELRGEVPKALASYEQASELALERDETELAALAKVRMAFLLQQGMLPTLTPGR